MGYIPNTDGDVKTILDTLGLDSMNELFAHIPSDLRLADQLNLEEALSEPQLFERMKKICTHNADTESFSSFLGGGAYNHFIPSVVPYLAGRGEFYTSYTPYQPEISQGTLQAIFEYQTLMCLLTGMDVSNASLYDGATATAEAVLMALRVTKRSTILLSSTVNPQYRAVIKTYATANDRAVHEIPFDEHGVTDAAVLSSLVDNETACVVLQSPNYFGIVEELEALEKAIHEKGALFIACFSEPLAFGMLRPPGMYEADIVSGEGQSLGLPMGFGGPYLGVLTCRERLVRNLPGRIVGKTVDMDGQTAYVLTLTAREQHIRRERSTSNICTNQGLCALTATIYLCAVGSCGLKRIAKLNCERALYAKKQLEKIRGVRIRFDRPSFNEFVISVQGGLQPLYDKCLQERILPGIPLGKSYEELGDCMLVTVTEMNSKEAIDDYCDTVGKALG
jgi:glycine dehydrogenase subunit 1